MSVTVLNLDVLPATACITASTVPRERIIVATWVPAFCGTVSSPTLRANCGSPVCFTPASSISQASSSEIQLSPLDR